MIHYSIQLICGWQLNTRTFSTWITKYDIDSNELAYDATLFE